MTKEIWKPVPGYDGRYEVSNFGKVKSLISKKTLKPHIINRGYCEIRLCKGGKYERFLVHRLVAEAFCKKPDGKNVVDHIDGSTKNNRADNLRWVTQKENVHFGRVVIRPVIRSKDGETDVYYESIRATVADGFNFPSVCECCQGKRKTHKGYKWKYAS